MKHRSCGEIETDIRSQMERFKECESTESRARQDSCNARKELSRLQQEFDAARAALAKGSPWDTEWSRRRTGVEVPVKET